MQFEWDEAKARSNLAKHGVSFELAKSVWDDPYAEQVRDDFTTEEERWIAIGVIGIVTLVVVHTYPHHPDESIVQIISAREASRHERRRYER